MAEDFELTEEVYCYCCEKFTQHEVYETDSEDKTDIAVVNLLYQCTDCGCQIDSEEDDVIRPDDEEQVEEDVWKTPEELRDAILDWQYEAGESFTDYFMDDTVDTKQWLHWLVGKGYSEHALPILALIREREVQPKKWSYISQHEKFEIYEDSVEGDEYTKADGTTAKWEGWQMNALVWAEFLLAFPEYVPKIKAFLTAEEY